MEANTKQIRQYQRQISELSSRGIPIAIQQTLSNTARHAWRYGRENTKQEFSLRNNWTIRSQNYTRAEGLNIDRMVASAGSSADYMAEQESGFSRISDKGVWVPTAEAANETGARTKPIVRQFRKGRIRLKRALKTKGNSASQQKYINMYNALATNGAYYGKLGGTRGMWMLEGGIVGGRIVLTGVRLLYSANRKVIRTKAHEWHIPGVVRAIEHDEGREYEKALERQLKRLKRKNRM